MWLVHALALWLVLVHSVRIMLGYTSMQRKVGKVQRSDVDSIRSFVSSGCVHPLATNQCGNGGPRALCCQRYPTINLSLSLPVNKNSFQVVNPYRNRIRFNITPSFHLLHKQDKIHSQWWDRDYTSCAHIFLIYWAGSSQRKPHVKPWHHHGWIMRFKLAPMFDVVS